MQWSRISHERMVQLVSEYRHLAEWMASQHGCLHLNFTGDGHLFLFENPDAGIQFGVRLIQSWRRGEPFAIAQGMPPIPLRIGCHFGECVPLENDAWIGRAISLAKRVENAALPDAVFATEGVLSVIDLPLYTFEDAGPHSLKGDHLATRTLYRIISVQEEALLQRAPQDMTAEAWFLRGVSLGGPDADSGEEEAECYREALRLRQDYPEVHNNLAVLLRQRGELAGAAEHYREALKYRPNYPEAHYNYAILLEMTDSKAGAGKHYEEALRLRLDYAEAHHAYANMLKAKRDLPAAQRHYQDALRIRPAYAEAHNNYAILLEDMAEPMQAEAHYRKALELAPSYKEAHYNFALLLESLGRLAEARGAYEEAIALWPDYPEARNNLAVLLHLSGDFETAAEHYRAALKLRPNDPEVHYNYGLLLEACGEPEKSAFHLRTAKDLTPDSPAFKSVIETPV